MTATAGADTRIGLVLRGAYRIEQKLGAGAFGAVYRATQLGLGKAVAVKLLMPEAFKTPGTVERFEREALLASKIAHPVMAQVLDFGFEQVGGERLPFLVMELVEGEEVAEILAKHGPFAPSRAVAIMRQLASLLSEVHARGIVHRDLKPANLKLLRYSPAARQVHLKALDFGIAKDVGSEAAQSLTATGSFVGTPRYMSPEQVKGLPVDARSDLYSCGVIFYELLTGDVPFRAASLAELIAKLLYDPVPPLPERYQEPLRGVVAKLLARDPAHRFADAHALDEALERCELACRGPGFDDAPIGAPVAFGATAAGSAAALSVGPGSGPRPGPAAPAARKPDVSQEALAATGVAQSNVVPLDSSRGGAGTKQPAGAVSSVGRAPRSRAVVFAAIGAALAVAAAALVILKPWAKDEDEDEKKPPEVAKVAPAPSPSDPAPAPVPAPDPVPAPAPAQAQALPGASAQLGNADPIPTQPLPPAPSPTTYTATISNPNFNIPPPLPAPAPVVASPEDLREECNRRLDQADDALRKAKLKKAASLAKALLSDPQAQGDKPCANLGLRLAARRIECEALCKVPDITAYKQCMRGLQSERGGKGSVLGGPNLVTARASVVQRVQETCAPFFQP